MSGRIIIVHGTSSSGKSSLITKMRDALPDQFCFYSVDFFHDGGFFPVTPMPRNTDEKREVERFMEGFHRSIASFASADLDLIVEHVLETQSYADDLASVLKPFDVFWVGVTASLDELNRREVARGDREPGMAALYRNSIQFREESFIVDTTMHDMSQHALSVIEAWQARR